MSEDQQFVQELCPDARVVSLKFSDGVRYVGSLGLGDYDKLQRSLTEDGVWVKLKKELNFKIMRQFES